MGKGNVAHYTTEYYLTVKKNTIMKFVGNWMEQEIILSEVSQFQRDKYGMELWILTV